MSGSSAVVPNLYAEQQHREDITDLQVVRGFMIAELHRTFDSSAPKGNKPDLRYGDLVLRFTRPSADHQLIDQAIERARRRGLIEFKGTNVQGARITATGMEFFETGEMPQDTQRQSGFSRAMNKLRIPALGTARIA
jgi:hypothetical protein